MIGRTIALAVALIFALIASQAPEFVQQYQQRLAGAADELGAVLARFDADAARSGMDRTEAIASMHANPQRLIRDQAISVQATEARHDRLLAQKSELAEAGPVGRLFVFVQRADGGLVAATLRDFQPAVPATLEGLTIAFIAFVLGYALMRIVAAAFSDPRRARIKGRPAQSRRDR